MTGQIVRLILARLGVAVITLLIVSIVVFSATQLLPGDVVEILLGQAATPEAIAGLRESMNLNDPAILQYGKWLMNLLQGDLGRSYANNMEIWDLIDSRLANTLRLAGVTTAIAVPLSLTLGILAAVYQGSLIDRIVTTSIISVVSITEFMIAATAMLIFSVWLNWLPSISFVDDADSLLDSLRAYAMPVMTLALVVSAQMIRMTRAAVVDALKMPYIEMALLKGASRARMVIHHALPNSVGPIANAMALSLSYLLGGAIIVETVFSYPGIAKVMVDAVATRDLPLIQSCAMIFCFGYLFLITCADIVAIVANPRLRNQ